MKTLLFFIGALILGNSNLAHAECNGAEYGKKLALYLFNDSVKTFNGSGYAYRPTTTEILFKDASPQTVGELFSVLHRNGSKIMRPFAINDGPFANDFPITMTIMSLKLNMPGVMNQSGVTGDQMIAMSLQEAFCSQ
jgi:hypothetical protein